jgi:YD repeat-containing protein
MFRRFGWGSDSGGIGGMMQRRGHYLLAGSVLAVASSAPASETITYAYDELGRLTTISRSGTVNNGVQASYGYDATDNRTNVTVSTSARPSPSPPPPPPPPPPGNQPPVAVADSGEVMKCQFQTTFMVLDNDYDPDGNTPLTILNVSYPGSLGTASNIDPRILFRPNGSGPGTAVVTYAIADSLGATATGTLTIAVVPGQCP